MLHKIAIFVVKMKIKLNWDAVGITTSIVCAIHCALLPILVSTLPVFGINLVHNQIFEWLMIALAFFIGMYALVHGYIKHHKNYLPFCLFLVGFACLILKQIFHESQLWFLLLAIIFIIIAHFYNYKLCHQSKCTSPHHKH